MAANVVELPVKKKRIRYKIPCYKKVYSVYQYDAVKYHRIYKKIQQLAIKYDENIFYRVNPYRVLNLCYLRDENNQLQELGDERHIFRYKTLDKVLREIADYLLIAYELEPSKEVLKYLFQKTHIIVYLRNGYNQAELYKTLDKSLKIRLKVHIKLLGYLQQGMEIEDAAKLAKSSVLIN